MALLKRYAWWVVAILALILLLGTYQYFGRLQARAEASARELRAAKAQTATLQDSLDTLRRALAVTIRRVDTLWRTRTVTLLVADTQHRRADSLVILAQGDTAPACALVRAALNARTTECETLRQVVRTDSQAIQLGQQRLLDTERSLQTAQGMATSLQFQLERVSKPYQCRLFLFVPCPSRGVAALLGGTVGFILARGAK